MDLIEGKKYYLMTDESHYSEIDIEHFGAFKRYKLDRISFTSSGHISEVYVLYTFTDGEYKVVFNNDQVQQKVFRNKDEILKYLVSHVENLGAPYRLDTYLKKKVKISQERNPELWI